MHRTPEALDTLIADADRTLRRQKICRKHLHENINKVVQQIEKIQQEISSNSDKMDEEHNTELNTKLQNLSSKITNMKPLNNILDSHKEYFAYISKFGKDLDKNFNKEINDAFQDYPLDRNLILNLIAEHFTREGKFELNELLRQECPGLVREEFEEEFKQIHALLEEIKRFNLSPVIEWAQKNRKHLNKLDSDLIFTLHRQQFINILKNSGKEQAIQYARANFQQFSAKYQGEIQRLMACLLYEDMEHSRYSELFDPDNWDDLGCLFLEEACRMHDTTPESALYLILSAGTLALPKFLKYFSLSALHNQKTKETEEFPIAIDLGRDFQYHSTFVCPVTKEISTQNNPPMLLKCGHVISEHAIKKIAGSKSKFKCPYCPVEQTNGAARKLYFN